MSKGGFTLIELLVVIAITATLAAVAWPTLTNLQQREQVQQETEAVAGVVRDAQERTLSEQIIYGARVDIANQRLDLISYGDTYTPGENYTTITSYHLTTGMAKILSTTLITPSPSSSQASEAIVRFATSGAPSKTGTITIQSTSPPVRQWTIEITPSGLVKTHAL